jgi:hypothetical protein
MRSTLYVAPFKLEKMTCIIYLYQRYIQACEWKWVALVYCRNNWEFLS